MHGGITSIKLEVIVTNAEEARLAAAAGADRLELVSAMDRGGLTPDLRTVEAVVAAVSIPIHAIVRIHDRGFVYDSHEHMRHVEDARRIGQLGVAAIVFGALDDNGMPDLASVREVAGAAKKSVTFHRAFDESTDMRAAYDLLACEVSIARVLTSGQARTAWEGRTLLRDLVDRHGPKVLPGGGITIENAGDLVRETHVDEVHVGSGARTGARLDPQKIERLRSEINMPYSWQRSS
ncbi:MAG: copper homeostasis protein CutC [Vulcanimicrobiaceae bacterium]